MQPLPTHEPLRDTASVEITRRFTQERVARFGAAMAVLALAFYLFRVVIVVAMGRPERLVHPSLVFHLLGALSFVPLWLFCRGGQRSERAVRLVECAGMVASSTGYLIAAAHLPVAGAPELAMVLGLTQGFIARAIFVPSTGRLTVLLGALIGAPLAVVTYYLYATAPEVSQTLLGRLLSGHSPNTLPTLVATIAVAWWALTVFIAFAGSKLIFGLRKEVADVKRLGQYTLEEKLGEGGMGQVFRASHAMLRRPTAIKLIRPTEMADQALARFEREVQLTAQLSNPHTITVFDYGRTPAGVFYYAMELLEGITLRELVEEHGPQPAGRVIRILDQSLAALSEAHRAGLIHRDIKPANIMLCQHGGDVDVVKVLDFGLVKDVTDGDSALTHANTITGTPMYLAPEAIERADDVSAQSDLYSLGCVAYALLTGRDVFAANSVVALMSHHLMTTPTKPSIHVPVPADLEAVILACLEKDPKARPASADALRALLASCVDSDTWSKEDARAWWSDARSNAPGPTQPSDARDWQFHETAAAE